MDDRDLRLLTVLQGNAKITNSKLSELISLSEAACWERVKRLEKNGYIRQYRTELAFEKFPEFIHFMVQIVLKKHRTVDFFNFEKETKLQPNIIRCVAVGGGVDYFLEVVVCDLTAYEKFMTTYLERNPVIETLRAFIITNNIKSSPVDLFYLFAKAP